jgi:hypothetical protein
MPDPLKNEVATASLRFAEHQQLQVLSSKYYALYRPWCREIVRRFLARTKENGEGHLEGFGQELAVRN